MDGVSWTADTSLLPAKIIGAEAFKANYIKAMTAKAGLLVDAAKIKSPEFKAEMEAAADRKFSGAGLELTALDAAPEHALLSWPHNATLSVGQANSDTLSFISPINGGLVETELTMTLQSWDAGKNTAVVTFTERPKLAAMAAHVAKAGAKDLTIRNDTDCRYEVDTVTGLVRKGDCTVVKGISAGGQSRLTEQHFVMSETLVE